MSTYYEVKRLLCRLFGCRDIEDTDDDIQIDLQSRRYTNEEQLGTCQLMINNSELKELFDAVSAKNSDGLELYSGNEYEIAIDLDYPMMRNQEFPIASEDAINGIQYELGNPSVEYCIYLLMQLKDAMNIQQGRGRTMLPTRLRRPMDFMRYSEGEGEVTWQSFLPRMFSELSIRIKRTSPVSLSTFRKYKTSFIFDFMYKSGIALIEFLDIPDMFHLNNSVRGRVDISRINTPPLREYTNDVVDYYKLALSSNDPYIKFISFYHVMEYFFDEVFKKKMVADLKGKITHPDFSYKDEDKVYEIALFVKNRIRMNDESGQGNELESLKYVLNEYMTIEELRDRIENIDSTALHYYKTSKVPFCNAPIIGWTDAQGVFTQISKRIYFTRNSLVHSKSGKSKECYRPYKDEKQLQMEIPLAKAIAELIIINSSNII